MNKPADTTWTPVRLVNWLKGYLEEKGIGRSFKTDAELLVCEALGCDRLELYLQFDKPALPEELAQLKSMIHRRTLNEPVAYITGRRDFYGLEFEVGPGVLVPRNETELSVEYVLERLAENAGDGPAAVLDFGAGSGAISAALAANAPAVSVIAVEKEPKALEYARRNLAKHRELFDQIGSSAKALLSNGFDQVQESTFDWIVTNPPYVDEAVMRELDDEVRLWEPEAALNGGTKGLDYFSALAANAPQRLNDGGSLVLEHGFDQREAILELFSQAGQWKLVRTLDDYSGLPRAIHFSKNR